MTVEYTFIGIKLLKIIQNKIRVKIFKMRERIFRIAVALHNIRVQHKDIKINRYNI